MDTKPILFTCFTRIIFSILILLPMLLNSKTIVWNRSAIDAALKTGFQAEPADDYSCWIFYQPGDSLEIVIAGEKFSSRQFPAADGFKWEKIGTVHLQSDIPLQLRFPGSIRKTAPIRLGYLLLTNAEIEPARAHRETHVFDSTPWLLKDGRFDEVQDIVSIRTFPVYESREAWLQRAADLKQHLLFSLGLWPLPEKTPLNGKVFDKKRCQDYQIEKVLFESYPGFYVTGNLYSPRKIKKPFPAILCPHGHWKNGRFENSETGSVPGRCINLARQGYIVLTYSMVGFNDSRQLKHKNPGPRAGLWGHGLMGLQTWNSIRAIDLLLELPEVDPQRIGVTGASGGGTQTFMLAAVDDRVQVAAPVNMVSSIFQGGCACENAPHLRLNTYNVEIAALFAPKPLLLVCCTGDWSRYNPQVAFRDIQQIYKLFGAEDKIGCEQFDYEHNYNQASREAVYRWMGQWLGTLPDWQNLKEKTFTMADLKNLEVFKPGKLPKNAQTPLQFEESLIQREQKFIQNIQPRKETDLPAFKTTMKYLFKKTLDADNLFEGKVVKKVLRNRGQGTSFRDNYVADIFAFGRQNAAEIIPGILYQPKPTQQHREQAVLLVSGKGKQTFYDYERNAPIDLVNDLLTANQAVFCLDVYGVGEFELQQQNMKREAQVQNFTTFNIQDLTLRIHDIVTGLRFLKQTGYVHIQLVGLDRAGLWCLMAAGLAPELVESVTIDVNKFDNSDDHSFLEHFNIAGIRKAGDFSTAAALLAPKKLILHNTGDEFSCGQINQIYDFYHKPDYLQISKNQIGLEQLAQVVLTGTIRQ